MRALLPSSLALILGATAASAQVLVPLDQDRYVLAHIEASDGAGTVTDSDSDQATDFGPFVSSVTASVDTGVASGTVGAFQDSEITSNSFRAEASAAGSSSGDTDLAYSESIASLDFSVATEVQFRISGFYAGYDQGYCSYYLTEIGGGQIAGDFGISEGQYNVDVSGTLEPGSYRMEFSAWGDAQPISDGFGYASADFDLTLELTPLSGNYCVAAPNSAGPGAELAPNGSQSLADNDFRVEVTGAVPNEFGLFFYGPDQAQAPFGDGFLCVGGQLFRLLPAVQVDGSGFATKQVDFSVAPAGAGAGKILPNSTWNFQLWYRDPAGPEGTGFNASDGLWVTFVP